MSSKHKIKIKRKKKPFLDVTKYSQKSIELTKKITKNEKKNNGIYFTPPKTIKHNLELLKEYISSIETILEPSCGSCEYINQLVNLNTNLKITGIEYNETIFNSIKEKETNNVEIINEDFIRYESEINYDLIIGNPPYYVMKKCAVDKKYYQYFDGRPNIFILFIIKSLELLNENGILSFILPKSFLNCIYYDKTRSHIYNNYKILNIVECYDDYIETKQDTILLIIQNTKNFDNSEYLLNKSMLYILGQPNYIKQLKQLYEDSCSLKDLGFNVSVGNLVWNQHKDILCDDKSKTLLIYSSDITNGVLDIKTYKNDKKKNYIDKKGEHGPLLVINRGYGVGSYNFNYCLIDIETDYLIENHLICIRYTKTKMESREELKKKYQMLIDSFNEPRTNTFIKLYFGNNAINTLELSTILPIYTSI